MTSIKNYEIIVPPTSEEVAEFALRCLSARTGVMLLVKPEGDDFNPNPEPGFMDFSVVTTHHPKAGGMTIIGEDAECNTVNLVISPDRDTPASLSSIS